MTEQPRSCSPAKVGDRERRAVASKRAVRYLVLASGISVVAGAPFLVMGEQSAESLVTDSAALARAQLRMSPAIGSSEPSRRVSTRSVARSSLVEPADYDCKPVRKDPGVVDQQYPVPLPPFSADVFPCTRCHDKPEDFNPKKRKLTLEHSEIKLHHGPREQWCYGCHNPADRDKLRLAGGRTVSFVESYELCGQCHGPKLRDWRLGIHGRRTGCWNGEREYLLCVHCHSPHAPKFKRLKPMPRPKKPTELQLRVRDKGGS